MNQNVNGHASDWVEWIQDPQRIRRREPEYVLAFANDNERLQKEKNIVIVTTTSKKIVSLVQSRGYSLKLLFVLYKSDSA